MFIKIDVRDIIRDHWATLVSFDTGERSDGDLALFYLVPLLVGLALTIAGPVLSDAALNLVVTALSIFVGLLLNLLLLLHGLIRKAIGPSAVDERTLLRQLYANISYEVLIAVAALAIAAVHMMFENQDDVVRCTSVAMFILAVHFMLTLLMILKRVHALLGREFHKPPSLS